MAYAVIRHYRASAELIDELGRRPGEVENLIEAFPVSRADYLARSKEGGFSITVFADQAGAEESVRVARQYIQDNVSDVAGEPPEVLQGEVTISFAGRGVGRERLREPPGQPP